MTVPPPLALLAPRVASLRPRAPDAAEIAELRRLVEDGRARSAGLAAALSQVEERMKAMEQHLATLAEAGSQSAATPSSKANKRDEPPGAAGAEDCTFSGRVHGQMVPDMLQLASSNRMTGVFKVELDGGEIRLYFDEGRIFHATGQGFVGENAFFAVFGADSGRYRFEECSELPREQTLTQSTQFLILEALRRIDEESGG